jgi:hypothetical protein
MPSPLTFWKSLANQKAEEPLAGSTQMPSKGILRRNPAKLKKSIRHAPPPGQLEHRPVPEKDPPIPASGSPLDEHDEVEPQL